MKNIAQDFGIIFRQLNIFLNHALEGTDISASETMYLGYLYQEDGVTQDDLVKAFSVDKAAVARTIQSMEEKQLVTRKSDSADKRAKRIFLTSKAISYKEKIIKLQDDWHKLTSAGISAGDSAIFEKVLNQITENARSLSK